MEKDKQTIVAPTEDEITGIARALIHADNVCKETLGTGLDGTRADLDRIQQIVDSGFVAREATYTLQALGMAFDKVFVNENSGYDWWMVQDEYGRDSAIRFQRTTLLGSRELCFLNAWKIPNPYMSLVCTTSYAAGCLSL